MEQKEVKRSNDKRKINIFLIFLLCSFLAWLVSRLSETYVDRTTFDLEYINIPDSLLLGDNSLKNVDVRLRASGFQFLGYYYNGKKIEIPYAKWLGLYGAKLLAIKQLNVPKSKEGLLAIDVAYDD